MEIVRQKFEDVTASSFGITGSKLEKDRQGCYKEPILEDHWNTFQEGWEECMKHYKISAPDTWVKVCPNKVNGTCQNHNLQCGYPDCEK